jgi:hypothetical protein
MILREEEWRVWEVDKIDKAQLEIFPVSRLDWDRISSIHVNMHTCLYSFLLKNQIYRYFLEQKMSV